MSMTKVQIEGNLQAALEAAHERSDTGFPGAVLHVSSAESGSWHIGWNENTPSGLGSPESQTWLGVVEQKDDGTW